MDWTETCSYSIQDLSHIVEILWLPLFKVIRMRGRVQVLVLGWVMLMHSRTLEFVSCCTEAFFLFSEFWRQRFAEIVCGKDRTNLDLGFSSMGFSV